MPKVTLQDRIKSVTEEVTAGLPLRQEHVDVLDEAVREAAGRLGNFGTDLLGLLHALAEVISQRSKGAAMLGGQERLLDAALKNNVTAGVLSAAFGRPFFEALEPGDVRDNPDGDA